MCSINMSLIYRFVYLFETTITGVCSMGSVLCYKDVWLVYTLVAKQHPQLRNWCESSPTLILIRINNLHYKLVHLTIKVINFEDIYINILFSIRVRTVYNCTVCGTPERRRIHDNNLLVGGAYTDYVYVHN